MAMDKQEVTFLILLDMSAAFDTVSHEILIDRLSTHVGITGKALDWIVSYLSDRRQAVKIRGVLSDELPLDCGVPQSSASGPLYYLIYTLPLGAILRKHSLKYHFYADDNQDYLTFKVKDVDDNIVRILSCLKDIREWLLTNMLKNNGDKTEFSVHGTQQQVAKLQDITLDIDGVSITPKSEVRNLGVIFDTDLSMKPHCKAVCKSANYNLHNISVVRPSLTKEAASMAIHAFVTSRLDNCNALLYGLPKVNLSPIQRVQNSAARCLTGTKRREHITPVLRDLHWLPITSRIEYKLMVLVYKALSGTGPEYLRELLVRYTSVRQGLRSHHNEMTLIEPRTFLVTGGERSFQKEAPLRRNMLPLSLKGADTLGKFKRGLKTHLYKRYFMS
jgi:hypothetical protein